MWTLYRLGAKDKPKSRDRHFDSKSTLVEDRVVLFQAIGFDDAIAQGIKEARSYCRRVRFVNIYGQKVRMQFLDACDAFILFDRKLAAGSEVYSRTELVRASVSDSAIIRRRIGLKTSEAKKARYKFMDGRILRKALAAMASKHNLGEH